MLGSAFGVNLNHCLTSTPSLVRQDLVKEYTPTGIVYTFTTNSLCHSPNVQIFNGDKVKFPDKPIGQLEIKVFSLAGNLKVQLSNLPTHPYPSLRTLSFFAENLMLNGYLLFRRLKPFWIFQKRSIRKRQKVFQADIYPDGFFCLGQRFYQCFIGNFQSESDKPTIGFASYPNLLDDRTFGQRAVPNNLDQTDILDIQPQPPTLISLNFSTVTIGKLQGSKAVRFFKAWVANFLAFLKPIKEALESFVKTAQNVLAGGKVEENQFFIGRPQIFKFKGLFVVGDFLLFFFPSIFAFFKGVVIKSARYFQKLAQQPALRFGRFEFVLISDPQPLTPPLRRNISFYYFHANLSNGANIIRAAPQGRQAATQFWKLFSQYPACITPKTVSNLSRCKIGNVQAKEKVYMVRLDGNFYNFTPKHSNALLQQLSKSLCHRTRKDRTAVFGAPNEVITNFANTTVVDSPSFALLFLQHAVHPLFNYTAPSNIILQREGGERAHSPVA
jgi:hypothetical protein